VQSKQPSWADEQLRTVAATAPGAIAPTGGAVPDDAQPSRPTARHDLDELVDALGLLLRAARDLDPTQSDSRIRALESDSEQTIIALQTRDSAAVSGADQAALSDRVATVAATTRGEIATVIERALSAIRASVLASD
jgi:hypothetical protein